MKRRILSSLMALVLVFGLLPATAFAEGETPDAELEVTAVETPSAEGRETQLAAPKVKIDDTLYGTLDQALKAAQDGATIQLGEGNYATYIAKYQPNYSGKNLTFEGKGNQTVWQIGAKNPNPDLLGTEYNGDYSFDGRGTAKEETVTFKNINFYVGTENYLGFIGIDNFVLENCTVNGIMTYGGTKTAKYKGVVFNAPTYAKNKKIDYSFYSIDGDVVTFKDCTFNGEGKFINVYTHYEEDDVTKTINFDSCTVNSTGNNKQPLNIKNGDSTRDTKRTVNWTINISGKNTFTSETTVENQPVNATTCSRWFSVQKDSSNPERDKLVTVNIDGETVWQDGKMVSHAIDTANDKYTDGYKDNAFTITPLGEWKNNGDGTESREVTKTCNYCGYETKDKETQNIPPIEWDVSKSKTATQLNTNTWTSDVTLSLPSAEEKLASDVVFVLDGSSSASPDVVDKSLRLLGELKKNVDDSGAAVNVCVVKFKRRAYKSEWFDLSKKFNDIKTAMEKEYSGGTNIHAGLLAGKAALDEHTNVSASRKYLILVSDGSTYLYSKDGNWDSDTPFTRSYHPAESYNTFAGGYWDNGYYEPNNYPEVNVARPKTTSDVAAWQAYLADVKARNETVNSEGKTGDDYDYHCNYDLNFNQGKPSADFKSQPCVKRSANNRDMAFYYANQAWQEMKNDGYHLFSIATKDSSAGAGNADDSRSFMNYLNEGEILNFSDIQQEILYAVGAGSKVTDTIGKKFDFVGIKSLTVGGKPLTMVNDDKDKNTWYFGNDKTVSAVNCRFMVVYDSAKDKFVWTIKENVSNFAPVQLTYTVKLTTPKTDPGTYGVEDLKGEKTLSGAEAEKALFTNERAVLNAKNSAGVPVEKQEFPKPSVSYTISSGIGGDDDDDDKYFFAIQKVDAQDGHALNGAKFKLYQLDKNDRIVNRRVVETRQQSSKNGIALFGVDNKNSYDGIWYYAEVSAPEGYVLDNTEHKIKATDFSDSLSTAVKYADTVRNYRGTTPDLLNDSDHFAYVIGYMDGNVRPYGLISRAETTTIFFRLLKDSVRDGNLLTSNTYTDVADDYWANTAISTMTGLGIVQGRSTTTFDPKAPITRAQFAAICARFDTGKSSGTQSFTDIKGHWAEKYIERAAELGWIKGFEDGTFRPDTYITRAQAMTMINRVLNRIPEDESDLLPGMNVWPDCNPGDWFYLAVQEATNSHDFEHKAGNYETWTGMNKDPDWTRYEH